jgi:hypothetical protein
MDRDSSLTLMADTIKGSLIWEKKKAEASIASQTQISIKASSDKTQCGVMECTNSPTETYTRGSSSPISVAEQAITYLVKGLMT